MLRNYCPSMLVALLSVACLVGCDRSNSAPPAPPPSVPTSQATVAASQPARVLALAPQPDEFHPVDPSKAGFSFDLRSTSMKWNAQGWISGSISQFNVIDSDGSSVPIALDSYTINDGQILTKHFGIIKARSSGGFSVDYLMQDSGLRHLQEALREFSSGSTLRWLTSDDGIGLKISARNVTFTNNFTKSTGTVDSLTVYDTQGHSADIPLKSNQFEDGMIHTAAYGDIYFTMSPPKDVNALSVGYGFKASGMQIKQLKALLGETATTSPAPSK